MKENEFKTKLCREIKDRFPGSMIFHLNPSEKRGVPDLIILYKNKWAVLEGKRSRDASRQLHQDYYVKLMDKMSFARFISPDNKEEILDELTEAFKS